MPALKENIPLPDPTVLTTAQLLREIQSLKDALDARFVGNEKAINSLQGLIDVRIESLNEKFKTSDATFNSRIVESETSRNDALNKAAKTIQDGLDKAERQLQQALDRAQQELHLALTEAEKRVNEKFDTKDRVMDDKVIHLRSLHEEKFSSIHIQFGERDTRTEQISLANKLAIDAALQAAKEAVGEQNKSNLLANSKSEAAFTKQIDQMTTIINSTAKAIDDKIDDLKNRLTTVESRANGMNYGAQVQKQDTKDNWAYVFGIGGLLVAVITVIILVVKTVN